MKYVLLAALSLSCMAAISQAVSETEALACPVTPYYFDTARTEPVCQADFDCGAGEKCCQWGQTKHCLTALDTSAKVGTCPIHTPHPLGRLGCRMDYGGCRFDSECSGDQKCCLNEDCGYSECKSPTGPPAPTSCTEIGCGPAPGPDCQLVELVRPNGPECEPVCSVCADPPTTTSAPRPCTLKGCPGPEAGPDCINVSETRPNGPGCGPVCRICLDEPVTEPPRFCTLIACSEPQAGPECQNVSVSQPNGPGCGPICRTCLDEPAAAEPPKACTRIGCGAPQAGPECQNVEETRPNGPGCEPLCRICLDSSPAPVTTTTGEIVTNPPKACTRIGCGAPPAGPECRNVEETRPNGPGCEPLCRICMDSPPVPITTTGELTTNEPPRACTRKGCGAPPAGPDCQNVEETRPNGDGCEPLCRICMDSPPEPIITAVESLACPATPFFYETRRNEPECEEDSDCQLGEKCCWWGRTKHCLQGVISTEKPGSCPRSAPSPLGMLGCRMDYSGCGFDSECTGDQKCCENADCGYKECKSPSLSLAADERVCTQIACGPAPGPDCSRVIYDRPNGAGCEPVCQVCADPVTTTTTTPRPQLCQMVWKFECDMRRPPINSDRWSERRHYWPRCGYVRTQVCDP